MEQNPADQSAHALYGLTPAAAKEYLLGLVSTLKLTEKQAGVLDAELSKWNSRAELANFKCRPDLAREAEKEVEQIKSKQRQLIAEIAGLQSQI